MKIRVLGAHNRESRTTSCTCILVNDTLAIDAGGLTSNLSTIEQYRLETIFITHRHYDHIRDIPGIALNLSMMNKCIDIYSTSKVNKTIKNHLLNGELYPKFHELPVVKPSINFIDINPYTSSKINGYEVIAIPVNHDENTVGFKISDQQGKTMFYTADTGPGLSDCWQHISPQLLFIDVTMPNMFEDFARQTGHLTPALLQKELTIFQHLKGHLPRIVAIHMDTKLEPIIRDEIETVANNLDIPITIAEEGMHFSI